MRIEQQFVQNHLSVTDAELVYSSSFLSVCCQWESLLEETIYEAVCGQASPKAANRRLAQFSGRGHLEKVLLFPAKDYLSLPTVKHAENVAALFVKDGRPISAIDEASRTFLQQAGVIRNAIAHQGSHAMDLFRSKVPGVASLQPSKRVPGAFLRHEFRQHPAQRRYQLYFAAFQKAATDIAAAW